MFAAEIYDYSYSTPLLVGIYQTEEMAEDAINIIVNQCLKKNPGIDAEARWVPFISPIELNTFTPIIMDWLGTE